jgi:hypothetical protein
MKALAIDAASASLRCCAAVGAIIAADIRSESKNFFLEIFAKMGCQNLDFSDIGEGIFIPLSNKIKNCIKNDV